MSNRGYNKEFQLEKQKEVIEAGIYLRPDVIPQDATVEKVRHIAEMLASGKSDTNVRKFITTEYEVKDGRTIDSYMAAAYRYLTPANWSEEKERICSKNIKTLQTIIDKCLDKENYKVARECIDTLNKTIGLYGGNSVTMMKDNKGNEAITITFE